MGRRAPNPVRHSITSFRITISVRVPVTTQIVPVMSIKSFILATLAMTAFIGAVLVAVAPEHGTALSIMQVRIARH